MFDALLMAFLPSSPFDLQEGPVPLPDSSGSADDGGGVFVKYKARCEAYGAWELPEPAVGWTSVATVGNHLVWLFDLSNPMI